MLSWKEFIDEDGIDYFVVELPEDQVSGNALINEGKWIASGKKDWMQRVDPQDPSLKQKRHVHVARSKHINIKTQQVAWNDDGRKHDKKTFNSKIGSLKVVQSVARQALSLPDKTKLEETSKIGKILNALNESTDLSEYKPLFKVKMA